MTELTPITYSVVVPVYRNAATIPALLERLDTLAELLDGPMEAVFVVDGSPDESGRLLREHLPGRPYRTQLLFHSRNFGSFAAIRSGYKAATGTYLAAMAADLQEPAQLLTEIFAKLATCEYDIAVGTRSSRQDPRTTIFLSRVFWSLYRRWVHKEIPAGGVDIFGCNRNVARHLLALDESHSSLVGLLYWLGFRRVEIPYERLARTEGRSGWTLRRKLRYFLDSVFSFTDVPILVLAGVGAVGACLTLVAALVVLVARLTGGIDQAGYTPLMLAILFSTFSMLFGMGVVGSYVWRTFENSKGRPTSVVMARHEFGPGSDGG
jgi:glycosyltransferase involved in cell wall biosynthesis